MKVIFLNTPLIGDKITRDMAGGLGFNATSQTLLPPLEFAIMATTLRKNKHKIIIIDPEAERLSSQEVISKLMDWKPDVVIASVSLPSLVNDTQFIRQLKNLYNLKVIAKTSINFDPLLKEILIRSGVDYCLIGEEDLEISSILEGLSKRGTVYFDKNKYVKNPPAIIQNMDNLPKPARDLLENYRYRYPLLGTNCTIVQTSRGCPFPCAYYCPYPLVQGGVWRAMSPKRVYQELAEIVKKYKIKNVLFRDATFTFNKKRASDICQMIIDKKLKFSWWCETRINCLDENLLKIMKKAGCRGINIGVETGDPVVMEIQGKPGVNIAQLEEIKTAADKVGIKLHFLLLIGLPEETKHSLYLTFELIKKLRPYSLGVTVITPYPGTKLYEDAKKRKWIKSEDWSKYCGNLPTMRTDHLVSWEMKIAQKMIQAEIFFQKKGFPGRIGLAVEDIAFKMWSKLSSSSKP